ncbi:HCL660Wp [Eremothecium sinecaudum]|uniref:HCL660Wp n=1 Tax=Eremothecium sinecaudum TaxID=45286 RepID=A0A109UVU5_9SACH|nr:HCL660Wp [Eremothecium sinecaudum]AMD19491.1 HCL660Wp [Eremothecium sinecaudum]
MKLSHIVSLTLTTSQLCSATSAPNRQMQGLHEGNHVGIPEGMLFKREYHELGAGLKSKIVQPILKSGVMQKGMMKKKTSTNKKVKTPGKSVPAASTPKELSVAAAGSKSGNRTSNPKAPAPEGVDVSRLPAYCKNDFHLIKNAIQLNQLQAECTVVKGTVSIQDYEEPIIDFGNINTIHGDLLIEESSSLLKVQGKNLKYIGQTFKLHDLTALTELDLPELGHIKTIYWRVVPILQTVVTSPRIESVESVLISDTSLTSIDDFYGNGELSSFNINNNRYMDHIKTNVRRITMQLSINANSQNLNLEMPELVAADNVTVRDAASVSFPKLEYVNQSFELIENNFETLYIPKLKRIGGTFGLIDNKNLETVNMSSVTTINGGLMVSNNSKLTTLDFLPELQQVGGAIQFEGTIDDTKFPKLRLVKGSAKIDSGSGNLDCSKWTRPSSGNSIIRGGQLECTSAGRRNTVSVSKDGIVLDRDSKEVSPNESFGTSIVLDKSKLGKLIWSLGFGWMIFLLIFVTLQ